MERTRVWRRYERGLVAGIAALILVGPAASGGIAGPLAPPAFTTVRQSVVGCTTTGGNGFSSGNMNVGGISADGTKVAFQSEASDLVPGDTNGVMDIFVHDNTTGCTTRVNVDALGNQSNGRSAQAGISADGTKVVFNSAATNLVPGDTNGFDDVFVKDLTTGAVTRASVDSSGTQGNDHSGWTDTSSQDDNVPIRGAITANGNKVAFTSHASNLVPGDTNTVADVFVRDLVANTTTRASVDSAGGEGFDPNTSPTSPCQVCPPRGSYHAAISTTGNVVTFTSWDDNLVPNDTNLVKDVFEHDLVTGQTIRVNVSSAGDQAIGVLDNYASDGGRPSADGRYVAFHSGATNLVVPDLNPGPFGNDVFVHDRVTGQTTIEDVSAAGVQGIGAIGAVWPDISGDGAVIAFSSDAPDLVPGDTNGGYDVFVAVRATNKITRVSVSSTGAQASCVGPCPGSPLLQSQPTSVGVAFTVVPGGKVDAAYYSNATNLVPGDIEGSPDVFSTRCRVCL